MKKISKMKMQKFVEKQIRKKISKWIWQYRKNK